MDDNDPKTFRTGDIVECIEAWGFGKRPIQEIGQQFLITGLKNCGICFDRQDFSYSAKRFKLIRRAGQPEKKAEVCRDCESTNVFAMPDGIPFCEKCFEQAKYLRPATPESRVDQNHRAWLANRDKPKPAETRVELKPQSTIQNNDRRVMNEINAAMIDQDHARDYVKNLEESMKHGCLKILKTHCRAECHVTLDTITAELQRGIDMLAKFKRSLPK